MGVLTSCQTTAIQKYILMVNVSLYKLKSQKSYSRLIYAKHDSAGNLTELASKSKKQLFFKNRKMVPRLDQGLDRNSAESLSQSLQNLWSLSTEIPGLAHC